MNKIFNSMMAMAIAAFTFTACEDVPEPYNNPYDQIKPEEPVEEVEPAGSGTVEDPYNIAKALEVCQEVGESGTTEKVYAKGIITSISDIDTGQYGNATFLIADNNSSSTLTVYRAYSLGGEKFTKSDEIAEGDTVVIYGNLVNYKSTTPEFTQGCYIYSIKKGEGSGETPATPGTAEAPLTVAEALAYTNALAADKQSAVGFVKGKICAIKEVDTGQYGNATYSISDDGTDNNALQVYRGYSLNGEKFKAADEIKVGDEVIITGKLVNYRGNTPQFAQGSSIYKLNGNGGNSGNNDNNNGTPKGSGTQTDPFNVAGIINATANLESGAFYNDGAEVYVSGIVTETKDISTQYGNATYYISDDANGSNKFYVFRGKLLDGASVAAATDLQVGDVVTVCGKVKNYNGTIEFDQGNYLTALTKGNAGNGNNDGGDVVTTLTNGDFETWAEGLPTGWKSACTASSATLAQSTDAHGGSYSVNVNGNETQNKRLASQEIELEAGTYVFSFWAKATVADASQARPGYVPVTDSGAGSYTYGDYATLSTSWQQVSYEFTLAAKTTVCLVVMNPKKSSYSSGKDILVDDATLTKK